MPRKRAAQSDSADTTSTQATSPALPFAPRMPARPFIDPDKVPKVVKHKPPTLEKVQTAYQAPAQRSSSNVLGDPTKNLQTFTLKDLAQFTKEGTYSNSASQDVHLFYVGRDNVHELLKYILSRVTVSLYLNMFGFDDAELNNILMEKALNPGITMLITLDKSQAGGVHEKALIEADEKYNLAAYNTHFVVGQSATHQISHTKGFVADGKVAAEGSTNWSTAGEGTFVVTGQAGGAGYKAQNNTQSVITDPDTIVRFQTELIAEHLTAQSAARTTGAKTNKPVALKPTPATAALQKREIAAAGGEVTPQTAAQKTLAKKVRAKKAAAAKAAAG